MFDLEGKRVVVTGAGGGIGRELVSLFSRLSADVIACDINEAALASIGVSASYAFDLRDPSACQSAVARIEQEGAIDILINNAGYSLAETLDDVTDAAWFGEVDTNLNGTRNITDRVLAAMLRRRLGTIVFVASVNANGHYGNPAYSAAKAGMLAYCRAIAVEYGRHGIRANSVCPGSVITKAWDHRIADDPGLIARTQSFYPLGRTVSAAEVAKATLFLASDLASGVTGAALPVDAGLSAGNVGFIDSILRTREV
ncbi:MAG: SDR family oxidoreductase [Devosia sp.]